VGAGSNANEDDLSIDEIRTLLRRLRAEVERLRAENASLTEENRAQREQLAAMIGSGGSGGGSNSAGSEHDRLRRKAQAQREAKRRRAAARAAAKPTARRRGKRSPRPAFVADETIERDVSAGELPADAAPNGFVDRHFYGVRIVRHNVLVRLREYISPTQGRTVAKLAEGWSGEFTPDTKVTINTLSIGGMTEPKIRELFADHGVMISAGEINHMLLATADMLREEQVAAHRAGMENSPVVGIDGTYSTRNGEPMVCHIVGNEVFTSMATTEHKDRVTVIGVLAGEPVGHCVGDHALAHPGLGVAAREVLRRVNNGEPVREGADAELVELSKELRTKGLDDVKMNRFLERAMPTASADTLRQMREATAGQWLRTILACLPLVMLADGGTNYHGILEFLQLCWIHILRPFSLLAESADSTRVLNEGWALYRRICEWRDSREPLEAATIGADFDRVFDPERCAETSVRHQVSLTQAHKDELLTLLRHPYAPAENNGQERSAKARVRKRDISFGPRSARGLRAWDTMQSVVGTLRKLQISPAAFIADRVMHRRRFERLDVLVKNECSRRYGSRSATTGTF
jgi:Transposase IS66 family